jgi:hypothetical protein
MHDLPRKDDKEREAPDPDSVSGGLNYVDDDGCTTGPNPLDFPDLGDYPRNPGGPVDPEAERGIFK